jgi:hypothetical protein
MSRSRRGAMVGALALAGCVRAPLGEEHNPGRDGSAGSAPSPDMVGQVAAIVPDPSPAAADTAPAAPGASAVPPPSCGELGADAHPDQLVALEWQWQRRACPSSACVDFLRIDQGCQLWFQRNDLPVTVTLSGTDCAAARGWATSERFLAALASGEDCVPQAPQEAFDVTLTDSRQYRRKTFGCSALPIAAVRACLGALVARLFP